MKESITSEEYAIISAVQELLAHLEMFHTTYGCKISAIGPGAGCDCGAGFELYGRNDFQHLAYVHGRYEVLWLRYPGGKINKDTDWSKGFKRSIWIYSDSWDF